MIEPQPLETVRRPWKSAGIEWDLLDRRRPLLLVIPAQAGIQGRLIFDGLPSLDSRLRGNDDALSARHTLPAFACIRDGAAAD
ncbi:hypothetical protein [Luteimonas suaedae]|uniref:hypothetical protein n=1 Tax=Luteimonas suaedae TaxID=2605430 RepID=UPI0011EEC19F|nr:hypothetical protein [Luteimonas suaedae]